MDDFVQDYDPRYTAALKMVADGEFGDKEYFKVHVVGPPLNELPVANINVKPFLHADC